MPSAGWISAVSRLCWGSTARPMLRALLPVVVHLLLPQCEGVQYSDPSLLDSTISHGMIIDAGSSGSRMHVYEWEPRVFTTLPPPISLPGSKNRWTHRMEPGISSYSTHLEDIPKALAPMVEFAKEVLKDYEEDWQRFPIYLKATAGVRQLSYDDREALLATVRDFLGNPETCPFYFQFDHARAISGEEEGIYGWAAVNFLRGDLLELSEGSGTADVGNKTVGTLDLGGASTEISFFRSDQDILANLFKLQIGGQKHWNVYTHSFLQFGLDSARKRMLTKVTNNVVRGVGNGEPLVVVDACLPKGFNESFVSPKDGKEYLIVPPNDGGNFDACDKQTIELLEEKSSPNNFCQFAFPGQCSVLGVYQPELPRDKGGNARFYGFSGFYKLWQFLNLDPETTVSDIIGEGKRLCGMSYEELSAYNHGRHGSHGNVKYLHKYCFMSSYVTMLLMRGFDFPADQLIYFVDEVGGYKVDWALGSMLYEINALPWSYVPPSEPVVKTSGAVAAAGPGPGSVGDAGSTSQPAGGSGRLHASVGAWVSIVAAVVAVAALIYGLLLRGKETNSRDRRNGRGGASSESSSFARVGEAMSPWRRPGALGAGGVIGKGADRGVGGGAGGGFGATPGSSSSTGGGNSNSARYESISEVYPQQGGV